MISVSADSFYLNALALRMRWEVKILPKPANSRAMPRDTPSQHSACHLPLTPPELTTWNGLQHEDDSKTGFSAKPKAEELCRGGGGMLFVTTLTKGL